MIAALILAAGLQAPLDTLAEKVMEEEGFRAHAYHDTLGVLTIGFGTDLDIGITREEAEFLLRSRLERAWACWDHWPGIGGVSLDMRAALTDASYQLGCSGALHFKKFLRALAERRWDDALAELEDSLWFRQTPARVRALQDAVRQEGGIE